MSLTDYHAKYFAHELTRRFPPHSVEKITVAFAGAQVDLGGKADRQIDENYGRILMERKDLSLEEIVALDRVQKSQTIDKEVNRRLRNKGLVTGRYPRIFLAADVARVVNTPRRLHQTPGI